jgi:hypothetical protein
MAVIVFLVFNSCSAGNKTGSAERPAADHVLLLATKQLGDSFMVDFNRSGNLILFKSHSLADPTVPHYTVRFFVYDLQADMVVYEGSVARGEVEWYEERKIKVSEIPGIIMPDEEVSTHTWLYDIDTKTKKSLGSSEKF